MRKLILVLVTACGTPNQPANGVDAQQQPNIDARNNVDAVGSQTNDPANDGPNVVTTQTVTIPGATADHNLPSTIYTPTGITTPPLVVISPGFQMARTQYDSYAHHMATWGFEVILTDYADQGFFADHQLMANDVGAVITYALPNVDANKIATAGHSLGGDISVLAAAGDPRVKAVVGWDPVDGSPSVVPEKMTGFTAKLAVIGETTDASGGFMPCAPTGDNFAAFYASAPSPSVAMTINGADHMDWVDDPSCALCTLCTAGTAAPDLARNATKRLNVAWLRSVFDADMTMTPWLMAPPEVAAGTATIQHK